MAGAPEARSVAGIVRRADRMLVLGVLNVTPDSFSDGGRFNGPDAAVRRGLELHAAGADLVDVGGESTRPGARRITAEQELARIRPVVTALAAAGVPVSVDTYRAEVAAATLAAGAQVINDVSGGLADPAMVDVVRDAGCPWILMHWRGHSDTMADHAVYDDVVSQVRTELLQRVDAVVSAGVSPDRLIIDPGIGFAKTAEHNWLVLGGIEAFVGTGLPVLVAASRKAFLGSLLAEGGVPRPATGRGDATTAITAYCAARGVWGVRVHDVAPNVDAAATVAAITRAAVRR